MPAFAFALPVLPGKEDLDRQVFEEMEGPRQEEYAAAMRDAGMTLHSVWHQQNPDGSVLALVYAEVDSEEGLAKFGSSDADFNRWFREQMQEVHGIDISGPPPPSRKIHEQRV